MTRPDDIRPRHMIEAAQKAVEFCEGRTRRDLDTDELLRLALTKLVEIVGEAAKQVDDDGRKRYPKVPWAEAARMRDRLVHHYFDNARGAPARALSLTRTVPKHPLARFDPPLRLRRLE